MQKLCIQDLDLNNKKVLVRVDFNIPQDEQLNITDDTRIVASLQTIKYILEKNGIVILMSHLGRPNGKKDSVFSLAPCAKRLSEIIQKPVILAPDSVGSEVEKLVAGLQPGQVLLLENLRFHPGEEHPEKEPNFVEQLAKLGDIYVNDAFGTAHREHASTALIAKYFPGKAAAGFLIQKEIEFLGQALLSPKRPFYAIIGGAKISSKLGVIRSLLNKVDRLFLGGGMAYTFLKAQGINIGKSIHEDDLLDTAKEILSMRNSKIFLPVDICTTSGSNIKIVEARQGIPNEFEGMDIGPETLKIWSEELKNAKTIFWNGPVGVAEIPQFAKGTEGIAKILAKSDAITIVGGGDSIAALQATGLSEKIDHVSTGGGASLEYIEFGKLPGIEALSVDK